MAAPLGEDTMDTLKTAPRGSAQLHEIDELTSQRLAEIFKVLGFVGWCVPVGYVEHVLI